MGDLLRGKAGTERWRRAADGCQAGCARNVLPLPGLRPFHRGVPPHRENRRLVEGEGWCRGAEEGR
jgi:hypothetical protein